MIIRGDKDYEAGQPPNPALMKAVGELMEKQTKAGVLVGGGGLYPSRDGALVTLARGKVTVKDGPFAEAKELIGGFAIVEVASKAEAVQMSRDFLQLHYDILGPTYEGISEVRQMHEE